MEKLNLAAPAGPRYVPQGLGLIWKGILPRRSYDWKALAIADAKHATKELV